MGAYVPSFSDGPLLVGVYVTPDHRGDEHGITDALLAAVEDWARDHGGRLTLHVHEDNARARGAYVKRGFVPTGRLIPYILDPTQRELEMSKRLD
jgi:GNAT superfamily N-acetyltransferase